MSNPQLCGSVLFLNLYDIAEEIRLPEVRRLLGLAPVVRESGLRHPAPEYLGFENPRVLEPLQ